MVCSKALLVLLAISLVQAESVDLRQKSPLQKLMNNILDKKKFHENLRDINREVGLPAACNASIADIPNQVQSLSNDVVQFRDFVKNVRKGVGECTKSGPGGVSGAIFCFKTLWSSLKEDAQGLVTNIQQTVSNIQADITTLQTCLPQCSLSPCGYQPPIVFPP